MAALPKVPGDPALLHGIVYAYSRSVQRGHYKGQIGEAGGAVRTTGAGAMDARDSGRECFELPLAGLGTPESLGGM